MKEITKEMEDFFNKRTNEHINRVRINCLKILQQMPKLKELEYRGQNHDSSKFSQNEYEPYIWLTEKYRCKNFEGKNFNIPQEIDIDSAVQHHYQNNRHHPEYHKNIKDMASLDIAEMIADWAAMSQEMKNSLKEWTDKSVDRFGFDKDQKALVYQLISFFPELE